MLIIGTHWPRGWADPLGGTFCGVEFLVRVQIQRSRHWLCEPSEVALIRPFIGCESTGAGESD